LNRLIDKLSINTEQTVEIYYTIALEKPKPSHSIPQEEWVSCIKSLSHIVNEKAKTYIVGFFNGDLKVYDPSNHSELLSVRSLHTDQIIEDALFLRNDLLNKKLVVTCGAKPNAEIRVSELSHVDKSYTLTPLAVSKEDQEGLKSLSYNPLNNQTFCSGGTVGSEGETGVLLWKLDESLISDGATTQVGKKQGGPTKRVKTGTNTLNPSTKIQCSGGI
jgi:hypothetical protein